MFRAQNRFLVTMLLLAVSWINGIVFATRLTANRTVTCAELAASSMATDPVVVPVPPAALPEAALIASCVDGALDNRSVVFAAAPGARLIVDGWMQTGGSVAVVPEQGSNDMLDVTVILTGRTVVHARLNGTSNMSVHAFSLVSTAGSVQKVQLRVHAGVQLSCTANCVEVDAPPGVCSVASVEALGNVSEAALQVEATSLNSTVLEECPVRASAGSVVSAGGKIEHGVLQFTDTSVTAVAVASVGRASAYATSASVAMLDTTAAVFANISLRARDCVAAGRARASDRLGTANAAAFALLAMGGSTVETNVTDAVILCERASLATTSSAHSGTAVAAGIASSNAEDMRLFLSATDVAATDSTIEAYGEGITAVASVAISVSTRKQATLVLRNVYLRASGGHYRSEVSLERGDGAAAAALGVAAAHWGGVTPGVRLSLTMLAISALDANVSALSGTLGSAATAAGVAAGSSGVRHAVTVDNASIAAVGGRVVASAVEQGSAASAAGVATAQYVFHRPHSGIVAANVSATTISVSGGAMVSATVAGRGSAASAVGVATATHTGKTGLPLARAVADAFLVNISLAVTDSNISAVGGEKGVAAAVVGIATGSYSATRRGSQGTSNISRVVVAASTSVMTATGVHYGSAAAVAGIATASYATGSGVSYSAAASNVSNIVISAFSCNATATTEKIATAAAAIGVATASNCIGRTSVATFVDRVTFTVDSGNATAVTGWGKSAAAAAGVATSGGAHARGANGWIRIVANVSATTMSVFHGAVTAQTGYNGVAAAALGVATSSYNPGANEGCDEKTEVGVVNTTMTASNALVSARATRVGSAAAAVGIATGGYSRTAFAVASTRNTDVVGSIMAAVGGEVSAAAEDAGGAAAAVGVAAGASAQASRWTKADSSVSLRNSSLVAVGVVVSASVGALTSNYRGGSAAAGVGVAAGCKCTNPLECRSTARVSSAVMLAWRGALRVLSGARGDAAAALGVANAHQCLHGLGALECSSVTFVTNSTVAAWDSVVHAESAIQGAAACAVGIATGANSQTKYPVAAAFVSGTTLVANRSNLSSVAGSQGAAAASIGVAAASFGDADRTDSTIELSQVVFASADSNATAVTGTDASAAAVAGVGISNATRPGLRLDAVSVQLCRSQILESSASDTAVVAADRSNCSSAALIGPVVFVFSSVINSSLPAGGGAVFPMPRFGSRVWLSRSVVHATHSACFEASELPCWSANPGRDIAILGSTLSCAAVGWNSSQRQANVTIVNSSVGLLSAELERNSQLQGVFPGANIVRTTPRSGPDEGIEGQACAPVRLPPLPEICDVADSWAALHGHDASDGESTAQLLRTMTTTVWQEHLGTSTMTSTATRSVDRLPADGEAPIGSNQPDGADPSTPPSAIQSPDTAAGGDKHTSSEIASHTLTASPSRAVTVSATRDAPLQRSDVGPLDRAVPRVAREASGGTAVIATAAVRLFPGYTSPGAAGTAARFTSIPQLLLCSEVEDPTLVELPWKGILGATTFARLAERALAASIICALFTIIGAVSLARGIGPRGLGQAAFIVPVSYVGPAITGVAIQMVSFHAQRARDDFGPMDAESGEQLSLPTSRDVAVASAAAILSWLMLVPMARVVVRNPKRDHDERRAASMSDNTADVPQLEAALEDLLCGGLREEQLRGCFGLGVDPMDAAARHSSPAGNESNRGGSDAAPGKPAHQPSRAIRAVVFIEIVSAHVFTLLAGVRGPDNICTIRAYAALLVALMFLYYVVTSQPLASRLDHAFQLAAAFLQLAAGGILIVGAAAGNEDAAENATTAGEWAATAGLWLVAVQAIVQAGYAVKSSGGAAVGDGSLTNKGSGGPPVSGSSVNAPLLVVPHAPALSADVMPNTARVPAPDDDEGITRAPKEQRLSNPLRK